MPSSLRPPKFVFLDRDGVLNVKMSPQQYVTRPEDLVLVPGSAAAVARLNDAGIAVFLVTNQRGIALGLFTENDLRTVHTCMGTLLAAEGAHLDAIYYCPHHRDACGCRKPLAGMFLQAFEDHPGANPLNSLMVGDSLSDIQAGHRLGMTTVLIQGPTDAIVDTGGEAERLATFRAASLGDFVRRLFERKA